MTMCLTTVWINLYVIVANLGKFTDIWAWSLVRQLSGVLCRRLYLPKLQFFKEELNFSKELEFSRSQLQVGNPTHLLAVSLIFYVIRSSVESTHMEKGKIINF